jgi:predicted helicase
VGAFADLFSQLDADDRIKGKQFEHICKWFLTNDPVYKHELRRVWLWNEWTGRWGGDAGIDLVAEDRQGHLWATQAKAYNPAYRVTKRDVNKFLAESGREVFAYRMLIATTNFIDRIGERTIQSQEKRVTFFRLNDLQAADVDWPRSPNDLQPVRPRKPARPRKYQREAISKVLNGFELAERGQLIMACGTGKTLTALFINEELGAARTLVLVPSLSLLKQTLNVWRANCANEFASLPVCSDDTVAKADDDIAVAHTSDIGVPVTTDPDEIVAFLRHGSSPRVVFATYQSSPQITNAFTLGKMPAFDLVIADEAHRCAGLVSSDFGTVLDPVKIKAKRRLFMTATPRYFTGRVLKAAKEAEFEYASMDDEAKFGNVFHRLGFGEAIKRDLLTDYQVAIVGVDDATYLEWAKNRVLVTRDDVEVTDAGTLAAQIGLAKAMREYGLKRVISFHSRVKRAREFAGSMPDVLAWMPARLRPEGELWSRYASGEMPAGDRYVLLQHLGRLDDGDRGLLANARCLAEGVDVPTLDGVAFIDPRRSEVDIVQAVGRAIRKSDDKTVGTIVIPVFINTDADPEAALDSSIFKPVWDVLKAIRAHDEELGEQLDEIRRELGRSGGRPRRPSKIRLDLPAKVGIDFTRAFDVRLVEQTTASWEFWFGLLERYVESQGDARVPQQHVLNDYKLGLWVGNQRARYDRGGMDPDYVRRLEELPGWSWDPHVDRWEESFTKLVASVDHYGSACLRNISLLQDDQLTGWVVRQRAVRNEGRLDTERERRLEALPGWT